MNQKALQEAVVSNDIVRVIVRALSMGQKALQEAVISNDIEAVRVIVRENPYLVPRRGQFEADHYYGAYDDDDESNSDGEEEDDDVDLDENEEPGIDNDNHGDYDEEDDEEDDDNEDEDDESGSESDGSHTSSGADQSQIAPGRELSALAICAVLGRVEIAKFLLCECGASSQDPTKPFGTSAFVYAATYNHPSIMRLMIEDVENYEVTHAMEKAIVHGFVDVLDVLYEHGCFGLTDTVCRYLQPALLLHTTSGATLPSVLQKLLLWFIERELLTPDLVKEWVRDLHEEGHTAELSIILDHYGVDRVTFPFDGFWENSPERGRIRSLVVDRCWDAECQPFTILDGISRAWGNSSHDSAARKLCLHHLTSMLDADSSLVYRSADGLQRSLLDFAVIFNLDMLDVLMPYLHRRTAQEGFRPVEPVLPVFPLGPTSPGNASYWLNKVQTHAGVQFLWACRRGDRKDSLRHYVVVKAKFCNCFAFETHEHEEEIDEGVAIVPPRSWAMSVRSLTRGSLGVLLTNRHFALFEEFLKNFLATLPKSARISVTSELLFDCRTTALTELKFDVVTYAEKKILALGVKFEKKLAVATKDSFYSAFLDLSEGLEKLQFLLSEEHISLVGSPTKKEIKESLEEFALLSPRELVHFQWLLQYYLDTSGASALKKLSWEVRCSLAQSGKQEALELLHRHNALLTGSSVDRSLIFTACLLGNARLLEMLAEELFERDRMPGLTMLLSCRDESHTGLLTLMDLAKVHNRGEVIAWLKGLEERIGPGARCLETITYS